MGRRVRRGTWEVSQDAVTAARASEEEARSRMEVEDIWEVQADRGMKTAGQVCGLNSW